MEEAVICHTRTGNSLSTSHWRGLCRLFECLTLERLSGESPKHFFALPCHVEYEDVRRLSSQRYGSET